MQIFNKKENWNTEAFFPNDRTMSCKSKQKKVNLSYLFSSSSGHTTPWGFLILGSRRLYGFLQRIIEKCNISYQQNLSFWKKTYEIKEKQFDYVRHISSLRRHLYAFHTTFKPIMQKIVRDDKIPAHFMIVAGQCFSRQNGGNLMAMEHQNTSEENTWSKIS